MISNLEQVRELVTEAIGAEAYLDYPQQSIPKGTRFAVVRMSSVPLLKDRFGRDVQSTLTYTIRVYARGQRELAEMADAIDEALRPYKLWNLGQSPSYSDAAYGPMMILTYDMVMDRRNNVFTTR